MNLQIMSDLHLEFDKFGDTSFVESLDPTGVDILVLAGDIFQLRDLGHCRANLHVLASKYRNIIFVPGNHEFYGYSIAAGTQRLQELEAEFPGLYALLPGREYHWGGYSFVGGTLWYEQAPAYIGTLSDHRLIRDLNPIAYRENAELLRFLNLRVRPGCVVVTHHLPAWRSVPTRFIGQPINHFFVDARGEHIIANGRPTLWIHGHTHDGCDYQLLDTRVVANPRGYRNEVKGIGAPVFKPKFLVQLTDLPHPLP